MIGLDTNVVLRLLVDDSAEQAAAARKLVADLPPGEKARIDQIVLVELAWVLRSVYGYHRERLTAALVRVLRHPRLDVEEREWALEAAYDAYENGGDFADLLIATRNRRAGCSTTYTFDRRAAPHPGFTHLRTDS